MSGSDPIVPPSPPDFPPPLAAPPPEERRPGFWSRLRARLLALRADFRAFVREHMLPLVLGGLMFTFAAVYLSNQIFIFVGPGEAGVLFHRLTYGTELDNIYGEGMHIIWPWNKMYIYNVRVQQNIVGVEALSSNGLTIKVTVSMRYYPEYKYLPLLHQKVGPDYDAAVVQPEVITGVREVIGKYRPEDLYTLKTSDISDAIIFSVARRISDKFIVLDTVDVTNIRLPELVTTAIEKKLTEEQVSQEYEFRNTINASITPDLLRSKGIDATLELAKSPNSKVIVIGSGRDGLPLILNPDSPVTVPAPASASRAAAAR
jgi:regulator of protease activity HflC (stomatin/prohibitin superfamily)